jgi:smad nuclear-interacting protein 1
VTDNDRRKSTWRHWEPDEARDASSDRKVEREMAQVTNGDRRKSFHREDRDSGGKHREHDEGRDASRDRKAEREDARDKKSDRDDSKDHSRHRRAGKDDKSGASKETLSSPDDDRHDSRGGRSDRDDWKAASSREQRVDRTEKKDSSREKLTGREESNGGSEGHLGVVDLCLQMSTGIGAGMSPIHHRGSPEVQHVLRSLMISDPSLCISPFLHMYLAWCSLIA